MEAELKGKVIRITRDAKDKAIVEEPYPRPAKVTPAEYNSWRGDYSLSFDSETQAAAAFIRVKQFKDFDSAAAWLDRQ